MALTNPYQRYKQTSVETASPGELTLMLYQGCLKFIRLGKKAIENNDIENKNINLQKAQAIIRELMVTLNMDIEISKNLLQMYDYLYRRLIEANMKEDLGILNEVEGFVLDFHDTWKQVIQLNRQQQHQANASGQV